MKRPNWEAALERYCDKKGLSLTEDYASGVWSLLIGKNTWSFEQTYAMGLCFNSISFDGLFRTAYRQLIEQKDLDNVLEGLPS